MTFRVVVCCDGTPEDRPLMALEACRAFLPLPLSLTLTHPALDSHLDAAGWKVREKDGAHLCPACVRAILSA